MAQFDNICTTCLEREVPSCFDTLTFELGLENGSYVFRFIDRYGTYQTLTVESVDGVIEVESTSLPTGYLFAGRTAMLEVFAASDTGFCLPLSFTICEVVYTCIILTAVFYREKIAEYAVVCPCGEVEPPDPLADMEFIMTFTDLGTLPTGITAWDSLANWVTKLVNSGTAFSSILVDTDTFRDGLAGGSNMTLKATAFFNYQKLVSVEDKVGTVVALSTNSTFFNCDALVSVSFPGVITISGISIFNGCALLSTLYFPVLTTISGAGTFANCPSIISVTDASFPALTTISGGGTFSNGFGITTISLSALTSITGDTVFGSNTSLTSVTLNAVTVFSGVGIFQNCSSLSAITMNAVTDIQGNSAFENCTSLPSLTAANFPSLTTISGEGVFYGCTALVTVNLPSLLQITNIETWRNCTSLTTVLLPNVTSIFEAGLDIRTFQNCTALTTLDLSACTQLGDAGDNNIFLGITGNTIQVTVNSVLQTNNGGGMDGDLAYLDANNTVTFIWV